MQKNKFLQRAKISETQFHEILRLFAMDLNACQIAELLDINRNTANRYVKFIRKKIAKHCHRNCRCNFAQEAMQVDLVRGVRGRNPSMEHVLICLFEEQGCVSAELVPQRFTGLMQGIMRGKVRADAVVEVLGLTDCKAIADMGNKRIFHLPKKEDRDCSTRATITSVDRFWGVFKQRMVKMRGMKRGTLPYYLKECEFRFNNPQQDILARLHAIFAEEFPAHLDRQN